MIWMRSSLHTCCCVVIRDAFYLLLLLALSLCSSLFIYLLSTWLLLFFHHFAYFLRCFFNIISLYYSVFDQSYYFQTKRKENTFLFVRIRCQHHHHAENIATAYLHELALYEVPIAFALSVFFSQVSISRAYQTQQPTSHCQNRLLSRKSHSN